MKLNNNTCSKTAIALTLFLPLALTQAQTLPGASASPIAAAAAAAASANLARSKVTSAAVGKTAGQSRRAGGDPVDDRVELRTYQFTNTDEALPYAVFVSSKVSKDQKAPLVLALHGFGGNHGTFMRSGCVEEAEKNGYILVGVMGYSPSAPFGASMGRGGPGRRGGPGAPGAAPSQGPGAPAAPGAGPGAAPAAGPGGAPAAGPGTAPGGRGGAGGRGGMAMGGGRGGAPIGGTKETDSAKISVLSETDTMNVLYMALKEFNIDENRIYLMGHSMGGMGAMYIGEKYAPMWAAVACLAGFGSPDPNGKLKSTPLHFTAGSNDNLGSGGRTTAERLKAAGMDIEWKEVPGLDHGGIIAGAMPDVFKFFNAHVKPASK
jgi:predicted esterase